MSKLEDGKYPVSSAKKEGEADYIFGLDTGQRIKVNAPQLYEKDYKDCTYVVIQNEKKSTPILIYTPYSYKSACNYTVLD